jgi:hypothetical protein
MAPGLMRRVGICLEKGLPDRGGDHGALALRHMRQGVAHPMNPAALPSGAEHAIGGVAQAVVRIGDNELTPLRPRLTRPFKKPDQKGSASDGPVPRPTISRRPSVLTATAIIAATDTIRPHLRGEAAQREEKPQLAGIIVAPIPDRYGRQPELALREALNPEGLTVSPCIGLVSS